MSLKKDLRRIAFNRRKDTMKLTNNTTPQARNHQCDKCKSIKCHKDMYDDKICYDCWDKENE